MTHINNKLLKIFILADIIEAEIKAINPAVTINDTKSIQTIASLEGSCARYRKMYDSVGEDFAEKIGELSDMLDENIEEILKDI